MGWFSKCVCGVKNAKSHESKKSKKNDVKKKSRTREEIYVIHEKNNHATNEDEERRKPTDNCDNKDIVINHEGRYQQQIVDLAVESADFQERLARTNDAHRETNEWENDELPRTNDPKIHNSTVKFTVNEGEFYDSLSDASPDENTLKRNTLKNNNVSGKYHNGSVELPAFKDSSKPSSMVNGGCRISNNPWDSSKNKILVGQRVRRVEENNGAFIETFNNNLYNEKKTRDSMNNVLSYETDYFGLKEASEHPLEHQSDGLPIHGRKGGVPSARHSTNAKSTEVAERNEFDSEMREPSIRKSGNEQDFRSGMNSCSFVIPFQGNEVSLLKDNKKKKMNSMIPKLSSKNEIHRPIDDAVEKFNGT